MRILSLISILLSFPLAAQDWRSEWHFGIADSLAVGSLKTDPINGTDRSGGFGLSVGYAWRPGGPWSYRAQYENQYFRGSTGRGGADVFEPEGITLRNEFGVHSAAFHVVRGLPGVESKAYFFGGPTLGWWDKLETRGSTHRIDQGARPGFAAGLGYRLHDRWSVEGSYHWTSLAKDGENGFGISNAQWMQVALHFRWGH